MLEQKSGNKIKPKNSSQLSSLLRRRGIVKRGEASLDELTRFKISNLAKNNDVSGFFSAAKMGGMCKVSKGTYRAKEADMTKGFDDVSNSNIAQPSTFAMPDCAVTANILEIVAEVTDYSKQYLDNRAAFVGKLLGAQSVASAVQIQSDYAKTS